MRFLGQKYFLRSIVCILVAVLAATIGCETAGAPSAQVDVGEEQIGLGQENDDPERVMLTVDGTPLHAWQLDAMVAERVARNKVDAAARWVEIKLKADIARERGLEATRENEFLLGFRWDWYLGTGLLTKHVHENVVKITEEDLRREYVANLDKYTRRFRAEVRHISVRDQSVANEIVEKAKVPETDFAELVKTYSHAEDKNKQGRVAGAYPLLKARLGKAAADAIKGASAGSILGPLKGRDGFEIIQVNKVAPESIMPLEKVRDRIADRLNDQARKATLKQLYEQQEADSSIEKTAEFIAMTEEGASVPEQPGAQPKSPDRVIVTVNGDSLYGWQMDLMQADRISKNEKTAAEMWLWVKLRAAAARALGIEEIREFYFLLDLRRQWYLASGILAANVEKNLPEITEEEIHQYYDDNLDKFTRPFRADVRHIRVAEREVAEQVLQEAKAPDAKFVELVKAYSTAKDKRQGGRIGSGYYGVLEKQLGKEAAEAIKQASEGSILGPFASEEGFEVVRVMRVIPELLSPFEQVRGRIVQMLKKETKLAAMNELYVQREQAATIEKSAELIALEQAGESEDVQSSAPVQLKIQPGQGAR